MMVKLWRCETCRKEIWFRAKFRSNECPAQILGTSFMYSATNQQFGT
jgi:hypothetical protein